jgi:hypothetical protein
MRLDPIEKKVIRAVGVALAVVIAIGAGLALTGRYKVFSEQKATEQRRQYEAEMARLMEQELVAEDMSRGVVRATLGPPDSIAGIGELSESWYYSNTKNYGDVILKFERGLLVDHERQKSDTDPPAPR